jgi:hypothetical protein
MAITYEVYRKSIMTSDCDHSFPGPNQAKLLPETETARDFESSTRRFQGPRGSMDFPQPESCLNSDPVFEPANSAGQEAAAYTALLLVFVDQQQMGDAGHRNFPHIDQYWLRVE